ncbi:hypothetical protein VNI00_006984 [Paramarasmius palmivorus]|uniref:Non-specific serine/threonine protein kinase n=1 Tax=Paramarasmius palmivorus TaxID=297713 RepID=A0AAW0D2Q1_9AGAR
MVSSQGYRPAAILRSGRVEVKKAGIGLTTWKGWKERWLVLKSNTLIAYKDMNEVEISFFIPLTTLKRLEHRGQRCVLLISSNAQYYFSFPSNNQLEGWCRDIRDLMPLGKGKLDALMLNLNQSSDANANTSDANDVLGEIIDDYASPQSEISILTSSSHAESPSTTITRSPVEPEPVLKDTQVSSSSSPRPLLTPIQRTVIRNAISILTHSMEPRLLRISDPGGGKSFDLVDLRLRPLLRLKRKWFRPCSELEVQVHDEQEMRAFKEALEDGYVLCQLYNTLLSNPVIRPDVRDTVNVAKFLAQCADSGLSVGDRFQLKDIEEASAESLTRVAHTIVSLVKVVRDSSSRLRAKRALVGHTDRRCVEERWVERWIETRLEKRSLRFDPFSEFVPSEGIHGIGIGIQNSRRIRAESEISAEFKLGPAGNRRLRDALRQDEDAIAALLNSALESDSVGFKELLLGLQGEDAQSCADLCQNVLDRCTMDQHALKHKVQRLLVKLSEAQDILPSSLFIKGVKRQDSDAHLGGSFGDIYRATYRGSEVAIKRIRIFQDTVARDRRKLLRGLCREAILWRTLQHPFLLPFFGVDSDTFLGLFCLVSPYMKNGTILKHLTESSGTDVDLRLFEIAQGLAYLHSQYIVHGDLRGSNILVDSDWHARIADFGLAVFSDATVGTNSSHHAGSVRWMAPELHHPASFGLTYFRRTFASDVYSFACVCVELYTGKPPFEDVPRDTAVLFKVMAGERPMPPVDEVFDEEISLHGLWSPGLGKTKPIRRTKGSRSY